MTKSNATTPSELPQITIRCRKHGPLVIELPVTEEGAAVVALRLNDHHGNPFDLPTHKRALALCRCGQSSCRPFCDGAHREHDFQAAETAIDRTESNL